MGLGTSVNGKKLATPYFRPAVTGFYGLVLEPLHCGDL